MSAGDGRGGARVRDALRVLWIIRSWIKFAAKDAAGGWLLRKIGGGAQNPCFFCRSRFLRLRGPGAVVALPHRRFNDQLAGD